jgi:Pre-mRNA cleavage and polyadenylation specificity factor
MTGSSNNADDDMFHDEVPFLAVGTGVIDEDGEDVSSRGRIILFQLRRTGDRTAKFELELHFVYDKEISLGPVTALNGLTCEGKSRLIVGAGAEITLEQWGSDKLTQVGFFHCYMQIQDVIVFKNFILLSDAYDSLHFLVYRESDKSLTLLAKDYEPTSMYATGLLSRGGSLSFVCHDDRQNLTFLSYAPREIAARGGNKLVSRADCHLGTQTTALNSHFCRSSLIINSATIDSSLVALKQQDPLHGKADDDQRFGLHYGTVDGGFGSITPMNEGTYWRLAALQSVMSNALESDCSLSHRAWRLYRRSTRRGGCKSNDRRKGVIDGDLVMKYVDLSIPEQEDLASAIGSTVDLILDNLLDLSFSSSCC